jgi:hypothetical protein
MGGTFGDRAMTTEEADPRLDQGNAEELELKPVH